MKIELNYRKATKNDIDIIIKLIADRIEWMNENNIDHWNNLNYLSFFTKSYFEKNIDCFYVAEQNNKIVASLALYETDEAWEQSDDALYIHHLVSSTECKGAGKLIFEFAENYAKEHGFKKIRIDSAINNDNLTKYYSSLGFKIVGTCVQEDYKGYLQEKQIKI